MKRLLLSLLLTIYSVTAWCQYPHNHIQNLQQVAQVTFPDSPAARSTKRGMVYTVTYDSIIYTASGASIKQGLGDVIQNAPLDSVYIGAIKGIVRSTSGTLVTEEILLNKV